MLQACRLGDDYSLLDILQSESISTVNLMETDDDGFNALMLAVVNNRSKCVEALLRNASNHNDFKSMVNQVDPYGCCSLMYSLYCIDVSIPLEISNIIDVDVNAQFQDVPILVHAYHLGHPNT